MLGGCTGQYAACATMPPQQTLSIDPFSEARRCSCGWWLDPLVSTYMLVWRYVILKYVIIKRYYGDMCYYGEWVCWTLFCTLIAP